jgi:RNA polymerase sigma-70 factor, ECF subfamily
MASTQRSRSRVGPLSCEDGVPTIDQFTIHLIRRKACQLIRYSGFSRSDREDIEQELRLKLVKQLARYTPQRGHRHAFVKAVVERHVASLLRDRRATKRDHRRICSLHVLVDIGDDEKIELAQSIGQRELNAQRHRHPRSDEELAQLTQDMAEVIAKLPDELRNLAERLKTQTRSEIARDTGIPRTSRNESIRRLRRRFENTGLKNYL